MQIRNRIQYPWTMDSSAECKFNKEYIPRVLSRLLGPRIVLLLLNICDVAECMLNVEHETEM